MAITLVEKFIPYVDEIFSTEAKKSLVSNNNFSWDGAHSIRLYRITTAPMNDYGRAAPAAGNWSRYGEVVGLDASTQTMILRKDRSFTFAIDTLDSDETGGALEAASALARQLRLVIIPEVDGYVFAQMVEHAGSKPTAIELTAENIYQHIIAANNELDSAEAPEDGRVLVVTGDTYLLMKQNKDIIMETNLSNEARLRGVISRIDGLNVVRVPSARVPNDFGFMVAHSVATVAPIKLAAYKTHKDPPGISGSLVEGRLNYDAFVLDNKADAIYYQAKTNP